MPSINFNQSALVALDTLRSINMDLEKAQNVISTGKEVANARDNAAVWAISKVMEADVTSFEAIEDSLNLGAATVGVARGASEQVTQLLQDMKTLIVSAQEDNVDRVKIQRDVDALRGQIESIVNAAQFNGLNLLQGGADVSVLSSLDRASTGVVTPRNISVSTVDLTQAQGTTGTTITAGAGAGNFGSATGTGSTGGSVGDATASIAAASPSATTGSSLTLTVTDAMDGDSSGDITYTVQIGTENYSFQVLDDAAKTVDQIRDEIVAAITTAGLPSGVEIAAGAGAGEFQITNNSAIDIPISFGDAAAGTGTEGNVDLAANALDGNGNNIATTTPTGATGSVTLTPAVTALSNTESVALTITDGAITAGSVFELAVGGEFVRVRAVEGDTGTTIVEKIRDRAASVVDEGVTLSSSLNSLTITNSTADVVAASFKGNLGSGGGGLESLGTLDVTTESGAKLALADVEVMLDTAIDAAASFGSAQKRIDIQKDFVISLQGSLESGISALTDADLEEASARLQSLQVQQQLNIQALTIANQAPQAILALFR